MIILGVDPGTRYTGYGVVEVGAGGERLIDSGVIRPADGLDHTLRLDCIYQGILTILDQVRPDHCAVEMPVHGKNVQSMLKLGRAQAAVMLAAMHREVPVTQYTPAEVKKSVTGNGRASKEQMVYMVAAMLRMPQPESHDAADALAIAICHYHRLRAPARGAHRDWASFVAANPDRVRSGG